MSPGLSFLLSGRLVVKANNSVLHKIEVNHLLQSIEWTALGQYPGLSNTWQVTIEAEEAPLTILHLDTAVIERMTETRPDLKLTLECIVAKDVSVKMYMVNKMKRDTESGRSGNKLSENFQQNISIPNNFTQTNLQENALFWPNNGQKI